MIVLRPVITWLVGALLGVLGKAVANGVGERIVARVVFKALRWLADLTPTDYDNRIVKELHDGYRRNST